MIDDEIKSIIHFLGRDNDVDGEIRDRHLNKVLTYFIETKTEPMQKTLNKLSLLCGINQRYLKENYILGLQDFDIIKVIGSNKQWEWIGLNGRGPVHEFTVVDAKMCENCGVKIASKECFTQYDCKNIIKGEIKNDS